MLAGGQTDLRALPARVQGQQGQYQATPPTSVAGPVRLPTGFCTATMPPARSEHPVARHTKATTITKVSSDAHVKQTEYCSL
jgi:hypothetical protein